MMMMMKHISISQKHGDMIIIWLNYDQNSAGKYKLQALIELMMSLLNKHLIILKPVKRTITTILSLPTRDT